MAYGQRILKKLPIVCSKKTSMLVSLSTLLARSKRRKEALFSCRFSDIPLAIAAVRAAEVHGKGLLLTLDISKPLSYSPEFALNAVLHLGRLSPVEVSVEVLTEPFQHSIDDALEAGALAVSPLAHGISQEQLMALLAWAHKRTIAYGVETVAHIPVVKDSSHPSRLVESTGVQAARIHLKASPQEIQQMVKDLKVPLLADSD